MYNMFDLELDSEDNDSVCVLLNDHSVRTFEMVCVCVIRRKALPTATQTKSEI